MPATALTRRTPWLLLLLCGLAPAPAFAQATMHVIEDLPDGFENGHSVGDLSDDGTVVVGTGSTSFGELTVVNEAFRWTRTTGTLGIRRNDQEWTNGLAVSADGSVIGGHASYGTLPAGIHPFRWNAFEGIVPFDDLPGGAIDGWVTAISADGSVIAGVGHTAQGPEAFRWTAATGTVGLAAGSDSWATGISADGTVIVGWGDPGVFGPSRPFRWTAATGMVFLGALAGGEDAIAYATGVSADGQVIIGHGGNSTGPGAEAWRWTQQTGIVGLGDLPGGLHAGVPEGISADGSVIVGHSNIGFGTAAFVWDPQRGMRNLRQVLVDEFGMAAALQDVNLTRAMDISADARVLLVGGHSTTSGIGKFWVIDLPRPLGTSPSCYPNCDASTQPPALNVQDFSCFLTRYAAADPWTNCDQSTQPPTLNVQDFSCFLTRYAAGCP